MEATDSPTLHHATTPILTTRLFCRGIYTHTHTLEETAASSSSLARVIITDLFINIPPADSEHEVIFMSFICPAWRVLKVTISSGGNWRATDFSKLCHETRHFSLPVRDLFHYIV